MLSEFFFSRLLQSQLEYVIWVIHSDRSYWAPVELFFSELLFGEEIYYMLTNIIGNSIRRSKKINLRNCIFLCLLKDRSFELLFIYQC